VRKQVTGKPSDGALVVLVKSKRHSIPSMRRYFRVLDIMGVEYILCEDRGLRDDGNQHLWTGI
jgi:hypothetical protein